MTVWSLQLLILREGDLAPTASMERKKRIPPRICYFRATQSWQKLWTHFSWIPGRSGHPDSVQTRKQEKGLLR